MRFLFIIDPLERLELAGDTSYALMLECVARGHDLYTCEVGHLGLEHDEAVCAAVSTQVRDAESPAEAFAVGARERRPLAEFDAVWIRQDPPVNVEYLQATWILERARGKTVLVNDPRGLRELNEHLCVLRFPDLTPPTLVTRDVARLREFMHEQGGAIIVKPIEGYGGLGIFKATDGDQNLSSILETATDAGRRWTMAQQFLPEATHHGDKRIVLVDGEPIGAVLRVTPPDEARNNLHVGGRALKTEITDAELAIIEAIRPTLREYGCLLVGLDVIGGRLTEINITSPTGIRHITELDGINAATPVVVCVEEKARALAGAE